ncbi:MAG: RNA methyltransferase, partial [Deltaproteobacteria bacterium]
MRLHLGLVHYPVYDKNGQRIASAVTPVDIHDLARIARTYGAGTFQIITPLKDQQELVDRIRTHWTAGFGASYNPHRREAVERVAIADSLEDG